MTKVRISWKEQSESGTTIQYLDKSGNKTTDIKQAKVFATVAEAEAWVHENS
jgi:hypothetical protein